MSINLGQLLFQKFNWMDARLLEQLNKSTFGKISRAESMVFAALDSDNFNAVTISDLARKLGISRQAAQKTVNDLVNKELLILKQSSANKSAKLVKLTPRGHKCVDLAQSSFQSIEKKIAQKIGKDKLLELRKILESEWDS